MPINLRQCYLAGQSRFCDAVVRLRDLWREWTKVVLIQGADAGAAGRGTCAGAAGTELVLVLVLAL